MSNSLLINAPKIVQQNTPLRGVPSGSTAEPDYNVKYVPQTLTEEQQAQARQNIGAAADGEGGGATINEFHFKRDASVEPVVYYIDADGYEPKEDDMMVLVFDWPMYPSNNPFVLKNNIDDPSIVVLNAPTTMTASNIEGTPYASWLVKLTKIDNVWTAYNVSTIECPDWNLELSVGSTDIPVGYIKNKPAIPADVIKTSNYLHTRIYATGWGGNINAVRTESLQYYMDGVRQTNVNKIPIGTRYQGVYNIVDIISDNIMNQIVHSPLIITDVDTDSTIMIERWGDQNITYLNATLPNNFAGKIVAKLHNRGSHVDIWTATGYNGPTPIDLTCFYDNYYWSCPGRAGVAFVGALVFPNLPVPTNTGSYTILPDMTNCSGIYVHSSKVNAFKTWISGLYVANTDLSSIFDKIIAYESVSWTTELDYHITLTAELDAQIEETVITSFRDNDHIGINAVISSVDTEVSNNNGLELMWVNGTKTFDFNHFKKGVNLQKFAPGSAPYHNVLNPAVKTGDYTIIRNVKTAMAGFSGSANVTGKILTEIFLTAAPSENPLMESYGWGTPNTPDCVTLIHGAFFWDSCANGQAVLYGKIIYTDTKPLNVNPDTPFTVLPDITNLDGIYVKNSILNDVKQWLANNYDQSVDTTALLAKVYGYDYLTDFHVSIPGDAPVPMTNA